MIENTCINILKQNPNCVLTIGFSVDENLFLLGLKDIGGNFFSPKPFRFLADNYGIKEAFNFLKNFGGKYDAEGNRLNSPPYDPKAEKILISMNIEEIKL